MGDSPVVEPDGQVCPRVRSIICTLNKNVHHERIASIIRRSIEDVIYPECGKEWTNHLDLCLLHYAVLRNDGLLLKTLLQDSTDVDVPSVNGETPLYMAAYCGNTELVELLLYHGASLTTTSPATESALLGAVRGNSEACTKLLLKIGSLVNVACDDWTPLHVACFQKNATLVRLLLSYGANVNVVGEWSYMPLNLLFIEFARREQFFTWYTDESAIIACLEILLGAGNVDVNYSSKCTIGNPPAVQRAITLLSPTILRLLLNNGASAECLFAPAQRSVHDELVMLSIRKSSIAGSLEERVMRYCTCLQLLLEHGIEPTGYTLPEAMRLLLHQLRDVPLSRRRPEMEPVFAMLLNVATHPRPLRSLCRRFFRASLGHRLTERVHALVAAGRLPTMLAKYVLLYEPGECVHQPSHGRTDVEK